jgi:hydroxymethylpyrimidine/phosphomethylpyrimidine kinase
MNNKIEFKSSGTRLVNTDKAQFTLVNEHLSVEHNEVDEFLKQSKPLILSIAGFDPCGGAGILADIKTAEFNGCMGMAVITANTIQTEDEFFDVGWIEEEKIVKQLEALLQKYTFSAVKIGIVESFEVLGNLVKTVRKYQPDVFIVWDTVLAASSGFDFVSTIQNEALITVLKSVNLITPNAKEVLKLTSKTDELEGANWIAEYTNVLLKGGHRENNLGVDSLFISDEVIDLLPVETEGLTSKHGSGCMLSSAIASYVASGKSISEACELAKRFIEKQLSSNQTLLAYYV